MNTVTVNQFDPLTTSFRELKAMVGRTAGQKLPGAKALRESADEILFSFERGDVTLTVFTSGYFIYECYGKETVSAVDRCKELVYEYQDGEIRKVEEPDFREGPCLIPLLMVGDERIAHNLDNYEWYWHEFSLNNDGEDWTAEASAQSAEESFLHSEDIACVRDGIGDLTERQRQIVRLYYFENMTQEQIAEVTGISQQAISKMLDAAARKLRKRF